MNSARLRPALLLAMIPILAVTSVLAWRHGGDPSDIRAGVGLVMVEGARSGDTIIVRRDGDQVGETTVNEAGAAVVSGLEPGQVTVEQRRDGHRIILRDVEVASIDDPYELQGADLLPGRNYIPTRDGTLLSAWVTLPGPVEQGPYPTVVEFSAYRIGDEGDRDDAPIDDVISGTQPATAAARALGYATVGVNVRGSGCSGGALDLFGPTFAADGHDIVETIGSQPWVSNGRVGLVGFSLGGLSALRIAATTPDSLAAVVGLSVYGDAWSLYHPGGLDNVGFPVAWSRDLVDDAGPMGAGWVRDRVESGDTVCRDNQAFHDQLTDPAAGLVDADGRGPRFNEVSATTWAPDIDVPVLVSGQFHDATVGSDIASSFDWFTGTDERRLVLTNGSHGDGIALQIIARYAEFLDLYVANEVPRPFTDVLGSMLPETGLDPRQVPLGPPIAEGVSSAADLDTARRIWAEAGSVEILWGSGAGDPPASAAAVASTRHRSWPPEPSDTRTLHLAPNGQLTVDPVDHGADASFETDSSLAAKPWSTEGSSLIANEVEGFTAPTPGTALRWTSDPLTADEVLAGSASVDLWLRLERPDADLQAVLLMVDEAGNETMIQNGWARIGYRRETDRSTDTHVVIDFDEDAHRPVSPGEWTRARIDIPAFAQAVPAGSRLRLQIGTPGDGQVQWSFGPQPDGDGRVWIGQAAERASALVLPVADIDVDVPPAECGELRAQPCRSEQPLEHVDVGG